MIILSIKSANKAKALYLKKQKNYDIIYIQMKDMKNILNGVIGVAVAREIVALQGTDHPRDFPPYIGVYASWLDSLPDKQEVLGSSPRAPTKRIPFTASKWSRDRQSHHKGCVKPYLPLYWGLAQQVRAPDC